MSLGHLPGHTNLQLSHPKLSRRFHPALETSETFGHGRASGIGLALVQELVKPHGGQSRSTAWRAMGIIKQGIELYIVVIDHLMPGMLGAELARRLRAEWSGTKVLIVSGYAETMGIASPPVSPSPSATRSLPQA